jgi:hypothetical protein
MIVNLFDLMLADALRSLVPLSPSLALCLLFKFFISSTRFTESISASKYPRGYVAYHSRVAMFVPFLTLVWGAILSLTGGKRGRRVGVTVGFGCSRGGSQGQGKGTATLLQGRVKKKSSRRPPTITFSKSTDFVYSRFGNSCPTLLKRFEIPEIPEIPEIQKIAKKN